jgi:hypothetical protein
MRPERELFNADKFQRAIHYIVWKAGNRKGFGATKLNKVLWFSDARMYVLHHKSITGATYIREKHGPVPKQFIAARESLVKSGTIEVWKDGQQTRFRAKSEPDMSSFESNEIKTLNQWIDTIDKDHTATSISDKTHDYGWEIAHEGEEIPLIAILAEKNIRQPNDDELTWALEKVKQRGLR